MAEQAATCTIRVDHDSSSINISGSFNVWQNDTYKQSTTAAQCSIASNRSNANTSARHLQWHRRRHFASRAATSYRQHANAALARQASRNLDTLTSFVDLQIKQRDRLASIILTSSYSRSTVARNPGLLSPSVALRQHQLTWLRRTREVDDGMEESDGVDQSVFEGDRKFLS